MKLGRAKCTLMMAMIMFGGCVTTRGPAAPAYAPTSQPAGDVAAQSGLANAMAILKTVLDTTIRMEAAVNHIEASARLDSNMRATVGGKNDSVTAWLYGAAACLSWLAYPLVWRPLRNRLTLDSTRRPSVGDCPATGPAERDASCQGLASASGEKT